MYYELMTCVMNGVKLKCNFTTILNVKYSKQKEPETKCIFAILTYSDTVVLRQYYEIKEY